MTLARRLTISRGGQVSVPAAIRQRWGTASVLAEDHGDHLVLRPAPDDPVAAVMGMFAEDFARTGVTAEDARERLRQDDAAADARRA